MVKHPRPRVPVGRDHRSLHDWRLRSVTLVGSQQSRWLVNRCQEQRYSQATKGHVHGVKFLSNVGSLRDTVLVKTGLREGHRDNFNFPKMEQ